jgi:hypothetical protein
MEAGVADAGQDHARPWIYRFGYGSRGNEQRPQSAGGPVGALQVGQDADQPLGPEGEGVIKQHQGNEGFVREPVEGHLRIEDGGAGRIHQRMDHAEPYRKTHGAFANQGARCLFRQAIPAQSGFLQVHHVPFTVWRQA